MGVGDLLSWGGLYWLMLAFMCASFTFAAVRALQSWLAVTYSWVQLQQADHDGSGANVGGFERSVAALRLALQETSNGRLFSATLRDLASNDLNTLQVASECIVTAIAAASMVDEVNARVASSKAWANALLAPPLLQPLKCSFLSSAQAGPSRETVSFSLVGYIVKAYGDRCTDLLKLISVRTLTAKVTTRAFLDAATAPQVTAASVYFMCNRNSGGVCGFMKERMVFFLLFPSAVWLTNLNACLRFAAAAWWLGFFGSGVVTDLCAGPY